MLLYHYSIGNMKYRSTILKHFLENDILIQSSTKIKFSGTMYRRTRSCQPNSDSESRLLHPR